MLSFEKQNIVPARQEKAVQRQTIENLSYYMIVLTSFINSRTILVIGSISCQTVR